MIGKELQFSDRIRRFSFFAQSEKPDDSEKRGEYQMARKRRAPTEEQEQEGRESQKRKFVACVFHLHIPHAEATEH